VTKSVQFHKNGNGENLIQAKPWVVGFVAGVLLILNAVGPIVTFYVAIVTSKSSIAQHYATKTEVTSMAREFRGRFHRIESGIAEVAGDVAYMRGVIEKERGSLE